MAYKRTTGFVWVGTLALLRGSVAEAESETLFGDPFLRDPGSSGIRVPPGFGFRIGQTRQYAQWTCPQGIRRKVSE